jgi:hypothetical protein
LFKTGWGVQNPDLLVRLKQNKQKRSYVFSFDEAKRSAFINFTYSKKNVFIASEDPNEPSWARSTTYSQSRSKPGQSYQLPSMYYLTKND